MSAPRYVAHSIYVGDASSAAALDASWAIVHAAKEPWHREKYDYSTLGAPKDEHYYFGIDGRELFLNLVDAPDPRFIHDCILDVSLGFVLRWRNAGKKILIHCNEGTSRSPWLAFYVICSLNEDRWQDVEQMLVATVPKLSMKSAMRTRVMELLRDTA